MSRSNELGRYLSYVLRHNPAELDVELEVGGWAPTRDLLSALQARRPDTTMEDIRNAVRQDSKGRFSLSDDEERIRANQGHSVPVDLQLVRATPPSLLYQGTSEDLLQVLLREGLRRMQRHHVHLTADLPTAWQVARRRPRPVVVSVRAAAMVEAGIPFYLSANGVWLVDEVPPAYLVIDPACTHLAADA